MRSISNSSMMMKGSMTMDGEEYDIIRFGVRLRIVNRTTDRSLDSRGYPDLDTIRQAYPRALVRTAS